MSSFILLFVNQKPYFFFIQTKERLQEVEADYIARLAHLDRRLKELNAEKEKLLKERDSTLSTMRRTLNEKDKVNREQQAKLESRIQELEKIQENMKGYTIIMMLTKWILNL